MEPFHCYHPGSEIGFHLLSNKDKLINDVVAKPEAAIKRLSEQYKFGEKTEFWMTFCFLTIISPALSYIVNIKDLRGPSPDIVLSTIVCLLDTSEETKIQIDFAGLLEH